MGLSRILNACARTRYPNLEDSQLNSYQNFRSTGASTIESWIVLFPTYVDKNNWHETPPNLKIQVILFLRTWIKNNLAETWLDFKMHERIRKNNSDRNLEFGILNVDGRRTDDGSFHRGTTDKQRQPGLKNAAWK